MPKLESSDRLSAILTRDAASHLLTWMKVRHAGVRPGWGEDAPVCGEGLKGDGWLVVSEGKTAKMDYKAKVWHELDPPIIFRRPHPQWPKRYGLEMMISGFKEMGGPMYLTEHSILREKGPIEELGRSEWADWSQQGDLVFAKGGGLFRLHCKKGVLAPLDAAVKIADFSKLQFEPREAPWEARHWPSR